MTIEHRPITAGCSFDRQTPNASVLRLVDLRDAQQFTILQDRPGVHPYRGSRHYPEGWHVAKNIIEAGQRPAHLGDWPLLEYAETPSGLPLYPHQQRAVSFLLASIGDWEGCILGAQAGLGKSITALHALWLSGLLQKPGIVCAPLPAATVWCSDGGDANKQYGVKFTKLEGKKDVDPTQLIGHKHVFLNYDILTSWWMYLQTALQPAFIIFDEIHLLMSRSAQRAEAAYKLSKWSTIQARFGLTGTPIPNRRYDLWHQLRIVQPHQWGNTLYPFGMSYCNGRVDGDSHHTHYVYDGESNDTELRARLAGVLLRYNKRSVENNLPVLDRQAHFVDIGDERMTEYRRAARDIRAYLIETTDVEVGTRVVEIAGEEVQIKSNKIDALQLQGITLLVGLLSKFKATVAPDVLMDMLQTHAKIVVFTSRKDTAASIADSMKQCDVEVYGPITGTMKQAKREDTAKAFGSSTAPAAICIATLKSVGIAINDLKQASAALFVDLHWNTSTLIQAEARVDREGNPHKNIQSVYLVVRKTLDDRMLELLQEKAQAAVAVNEQDDQGINLVASLVPERTFSSKKMVADLCAALEGVEVED